jgi:hypothetical protein
LKLSEANVGLPWHWLRSIEQVLVRGRQLGENLDAPDAALQRPF